MSFLLRLLGLDGDRIPEGSKIEFFWSHAPRSWTVFLLLGALLAVLYGVFYFYRREMQSCPRKVRWSLAAIRATIMIILCLVFMGPALALSETRTLQSYVLLLIDESLSMSIRDGETAALGKDPENKLTRADQINELLLKDDSKFMKDLTQKGRVRVMSFADNIKVHQTLPAKEETAERMARTDVMDPAIQKEPPLPPLVPRGGSTNMTLGIREALKTLSGNPISGVVLITDGQHTTGEDPMIAVDMAAKRDVPIFTIGIGQNKAPKNLSILEIWAPDSVYRGDPFMLQANVEAKGLDDATVQLELRARESSTGEDKAKDQVIERKSVQMSGNPARQIVTFEHIPKADGIFIYTVQASPVNGENILTDNTKSMTIKVVGDKARVLLIAGSPSWDYRLTQTLLTRDKTINLSCWLQSMDPAMMQEGNTPIKTLPRDEQDLFAYDAILMFDPDPNEFDEAWVAMLKKYLGEHGGGMMWVSGPNYTPKFFSEARTRALGDVMPVALEDLSATDRLALGSTHTKEWPIRLTASGSDHALMRFSPDPETNRTLAERLPGVYWSYPVDKVRPAAQALIEHSDPRLRKGGKARPLLVVGQFGPGRVLFMGFDGTWRWRRFGEKVYDRFWIQAVRYLIEGRRLGSERRGRIGTDRDRYALGDRISISARLYDEKFNPLTEPVVPARITQGSDSPRAIDLGVVPDRPGEYQASWVASSLGVNEISLTLPGRSGASVRIAKQITVEIPQVEFADPRMNKPLLVEIAKRTKGQFFPFERAGEVAEAIANRRETLVLPGKPIELWDTNRLLLLLVGLLTVEWAVRKFFKLL